MRRLLVLTGLIVVLALLGALLWPQLQTALRYADLLRQPAPTAASLSDPLPGVRYADTWGGARSEGRRHEGVDIFAPRNTRIYAATEGVVSRIGEDRLGGRTVTVTGPGGYHHYYAHLERYPALKVGEWVTVGTVVGYVGDSGNAKGTPTHLHYGVYTPMWTAVNPYPLLRKD
ncbi:M23 family metallopeptidase [Deinococcus sp. KNUC1210]|uniref:M23 family metallopeptidase n=1 Tax=Deinococcus sp. KNUC1210 TaxID=2917691 RepID=UPI001EF03E43|nr:M23 family metallopeptidase [Deinococcus sp. KNUC1210]ULH15748.1 M23 family metallopeptidase [Deinococcus sp. KNUC1210]